MFRQVSASLTTLTLQVIPRLRPRLRQAGFWFALPLPQPGFWWTEQTQDCEPPQNWNCNPESMKSNWCARVLEPLIEKLRLKRAKPCNLRKRCRSSKILNSAQEFQVSAFLNSINMSQTIGSQPPSVVTILSQCFLRVNSLAYPALQCPLFQQSKGAF